MPDRVRARAFVLPARGRDSYLSFITLTSLLNLLASDSILQYTRCHLRSRRSPCSLLKQHELVERRECEGRGIVLHIRPDRRLEFQNRQGLVDVVLGHPDSLTEGRLCAEHPVV